MYDFQIDRMTDNVLEAMGLDRLSYQKVRDAIGKEWQDQIALVWHVDDVIETAKSLQHYISLEYARAVLSGVFRHHDAEQGISWLTLELAAEAYFDLCPKCGEHVSIAENGDARCDYCGFIEKGYLNENL